MRPGYSSHAPVGAQRLSKSTGEKPRRAPSAAGSVRRSALFSRAVMRPLWGTLSFMWTALSLSLLLFLTVLGFAVMPFKARYAVTVPDQNAGRLGNRLGEQTGLWFFLTISRPHRAKIDQNGRRQQNSNHHKAETPAAI